MALWRCPNKYAPEFLTWHGDMYGPSTAASLPQGYVVASLRSGEMIVFNSVKEAQTAFTDGPPDVCLDEPLATALRCPLVYGEQCTLDEISWAALGTGIASEYNLAQTLKLMLTARKCRVRLRHIQAGQIPLV